MSGATVVKFKTLWENHPTIAGGGKPCPEFEHNCAVRMGVCLRKSGVKRIPGVEVCWFREHKGMGHYLRAEALANALKKTYIPGVMKPIKLKSEDFHKEISGKTGIIFFKDYWQRENNGKKETFENRTGDHIDLWNGSRLTAWFSWYRIHIRFGDTGIHNFRDDLSDWEDSREIWFWAIR